MIVKSDKSFDKDLNKITDKALCNKLADTIEKMQMSEKLNNIEGIKKLIGYSNYFRV